MTRVLVEAETEKLRQFVIEARSNAEVGPKADKTIQKLSETYQKHPELFDAEDKRLLNVLRGFLGVRLAAHGPPKKFAKIPKRKGDKLEHCWRCETPVDERFTEICPTCDSKAYHWRVCPVCKACGCQRVGDALV
ncbi:MAG TPA: hypothetical protein VGJ05_21510 [Fimbriiglobus sp.]